MGKITQHTKCKRAMLCTACIIRIIYFSRLIDLRPTCLISIARGGGGGGGLLKFYFVACSYFLLKLNLLKKFFQEYIIMY